MRNYDLDVATNASQVATMEDNKTQSDRRQADISRANQIRKGAVRGHAGGH